MERIAKQITLFIGIAYSLGLVSAQLWRAAHRWPQGLSVDVLNPGHLLFGAFMLGITLIIIIGSFAIEERKPVSEAREWYRSSYERHGKSTRLPPTVWKSIRWISTIGAYILPYYLVVGGILLAITGLDVATSAKFGIYFTALSLFWWLLRFLKDKGVLAEEEDIATPGTVLI